MMANMGRMMKVLIKTEDKESYVYRDMEVPAPQGDEVLIKVEAVSICGTDMYLYRWDETGREIGKLPFIPGHECAGVVVACGPEATLQSTGLVSVLQEGDQVAVENHFYCGECPLCEQDRRELCQRMHHYGGGRGTMYGGFAQYTLVSSKYCFHITKDLGAEEAALLEPLGVAHNAVEQLEVAGHDVLIQGVGPIGLLACQVAKIMGATRVIAADINDTRLVLAREMGADLIVNCNKTDLKQVIWQETGGVGIGRIAELTGDASMANNQFSLLRNAGIIVMIGLSKTTLSVEHPIDNIVHKAATLKGVFGRRIWHTWRSVEMLVAERKIDLLKIISHRFPMSRFEEAFQVLLRGEAVKVVVNPQE